MTVLSDQEREVINLLKDMDYKIDDEDEKSVALRVLGRARDLGIESFEELEHLIPDIEDEVLYPTRVLSEYMFD